MAFLEWLGRQGRLMLVAGLVAGLAFPGAGAIFAPWLPHLIAVMLFFGALRVGATGRVGVAGLRVRETLGLIAAYQVALPLALAGIAAVLGIIAHPAVLALLLVTAAPSVTGSPNLAALGGGDPAPALRMLVLGTALLPLTAWIVLSVLKIGGDPWAVTMAVARLLVLILGAGGLALLAHRVVPGTLRAISIMDGLSALVMTLMVLGLMSPAADALRHAPGRFALWLGIAVAVNFGLQGAAALVLRRWPMGERMSLSVVAGNRNIALYLLALPPETMAPVMLFIGCYQIPMYLTPYVLARVGRG